MTDRRPILGVVAGFVVGTYVDQAQRGVAPTFATLTETALQRASLVLAAELEHQKRALVTKVANEFRELGVLDEVSDEYDDYDDYDDDGDDEEDVPAAASAKIPVHEVIDARFEDENGFAKRVRERH